MQYGKRKKGEEGAEEEEKEKERCVYPVTAKTPPPDDWTPAEWFDSWFVVMSHRGPNLIQSKKKKEPHLIRPIIIYYQ